MHTGVSGVRLGVEPVEEGVVHRVHEKLPAGVAFSVWCLGLLGKVTGVHAGNPTLGYGGVVHFVHKKLPGGTQYLDT